MSPWSRTRRPCAAGLLLLMAAETPVFGQAPPAPPPPPAPLAPPSLGDALTGQAKSDYDTARILFDSGDYSGALVKFQHAFDLSQDARLLWNMAACEKSLRAYARVLRLVERYLHDGGPLLTEAQRDDAAAVLRTVRALVTSLRVVVNESGASVFVDGEPVGTTPLADPLLVDLGERHIRVTKPGFKEQVITQSAAGASDATISIALEREAQEGHLSI
jgi:hypothetical protein